jgi:hypothetical protein
MLIIAIGDTCWKGSVLAHLISRSQLTGMKGHQSVQRESFHRQTWGEKWKEKKSEWHLPCGLYIRRTLIPNVEVAAFN